MAQRKSPRQKRLKSALKKIETLSKKVTALIRDGKPFHRDLASLHTAIAKQYITELGQRIEDAEWFLDLIPNAGPIDIGSQLLYAATSFSHLKSNQFSGKPVYISITEGLMLGLFLTELSGTTANDIKMPVPSFILEFPPGTVYMYDHQTGYHETAYAIVTEAISPSFGDGLFIYLQGLPNDKSENVFDDHAEYFPLDISNGDEPISNVIEVCEEIRQEELREHGRFSRDSVGKIFGEEYYGADFREKIIRIIVNSIIYMNSESASVRHEDQRKIDKLRSISEHRKLKTKEKVELDLLENDDRWVLGTDIKITHRDIEEIEKDRKQTKSSGRKLTRPSLTRGHWRWQPYGKGRSLRKRIWIKPFIRGKELGGTAGRTFTLDENPFDLN